MHVRILDTANARDVQRFIQFPFELYAESTLWVPPMVDAMKLVMNRKRHPFYHHSMAEFLIAEHNGHTVGRLAVLDNRNYNVYRGSNVAFFYYFDCVDNSSVSKALFDVASAWARKQGLTQIIGPKGPMGVDGIGLLVEGFEHRPAMGIPYNYPYYEHLVLDAGFRKRGDLLSGYLSARDQLPERLLELAERVKTRRGLHVKTFASRSDMRQWLRRGAKALNEAFSGTYDFYPITEEEFSTAAEQMLRLINPKLIKLVMKGDIVVGFLFAFPDLSAALQRSRGRLWPLGWYYILREFTRTKWVNVNGLGLLPAYRGVGGNVLLYTEMTQTVKEFGFEHVDVVQVGEENSKSMAENEALGVRWYKRHRTYAKAI